MSIQINENKIIFTRDFKATAQQIFNAYTDQSLFEKWFHPQDATTEVYNFDVQTGGGAFFAIRAPQGTSYTVTQYNDVVEPRKIDYNDYFADKDGNIDEKMAGMRNIIHLTENDDGTTTIQSTAELPDPKAAQQLLDMGVEEGMNSTFDNLAKLVENK
ncbi:SRPBCC family protein [Staphylococcus sp. AS1337]|uniref:SRPBCC family protein n=1 Tax=Staphylococcus sp. AS1337 TaxID=3434042 RepID=UPI003F551681